MPLGSPIAIKYPVKAGAYAYISTPSDTTLILADTYYRLQGTFTNEILDQFAVEGTPPTLTYKGIKKQFEIKINVSLYSDTNTTALDLAIFKNNSLEINSVMCTLMKNLSQNYNISTVDVIQLEYNDTIEIRISSNKAGVVVRTTHANTAAQPFYR